MQIFPQKSVPPIKVVSPQAVPSGVVAVPAQDVVRSHDLARSAAVGGTVPGTIGPVNLCASLNVRGLSSAKTLARCVNFIAAGVTLAGAGAVVVFQPTSWPQLILGVGLFFGARFLALDALVKGAERAVAAREQILQLEAVQTQVAHAATLAMTVRERPDVTMAILRDLQKEVIDKLAACSKTKSDWDSVLDTCDKILAELRELEVATEHPACQKILAFKTGVELEIEKLARAAMDLLEQGNRIPAWIEGQRVRQDQLQAQKTRAERLAEVLKQVGALVGEVAELSSASQTVVDEVEQLTAEIKATEELFQYVDALTEIDVWLALAQSRGLSADTIRRLREQVVARRKELEACGVAI